MGGIVQEGANLTANNDTTPHRLSVTPLNFGGLKYPVKLTLSGLIPLPLECDYTGRILSQLPRSRVRGFGTVRDEDHRTGRQVKRGSTGGVCCGLKTVCPSGVERWATCKGPRSWMPKRSGMRLRSISGDRPGTCVVRRYGPHPNKPTKIEARRLALLGHPNFDRRGRGAGIRLDSSADGACEAVASTNAASRTSRFIGARIKICSSCRRRPGTQERFNGIGVENIRRMRIL